MLQNAIKQLCSLEKTPQHTETQLKELRISDIVTKGIDLTPRFHLEAIDTLIKMNVFEDSAMAAAKNLRKSMEEEKDATSSKNSESKKNKVAKTTIKENKVQRKMSSFFLPS